MREPYLRRSLVAASALSRRVRCSDQSLRTVRRSGSSTRESPGGSHSHSSGAACVPTSARVGSDNVWGGIGVPTGPGNTPLFPADTSPTLVVGGPKSQHDAHSPGHRAGAPRSEDSIVSQLSNSDEISGVALIARSATTKQARRVRVGRIGWWPSP